MSRRETRLRTASVTTAACSRGPNAARGTPRGSSARVRAAHSGQQTPCSRCSVTRDGDRRQLRDLMAPRLRRINELRPAEHVRARVAALGPMLDDLVDLLGRKQPSVPALVPRLTTTPSTRGLPTRTRRHRRRILRRRQRRVPRTPIQPPLELTHTSLEPLIRLDQLAHPQQQQNSRLTITIKDRLGLSPLHTPKFAAPPGSLHRGERVLCRGFGDPQCAVGRAAVRIDRGPPVSTRARVCHRTPIIGSCPRFWSLADRRRDLARCWQPGPCARSGVQGSWRRTAAAATMA